MRFLPYDKTTAIPNIIVDGARNPSTVLTLSHWPKSGCPAALRADTSTEIVFRYLDASPFHVDADVVSNNHFDEDGLAGIFTLLQPAVAARHRDLLIDVAQAGDFGVFASRHAARIVFVLTAFADPKASPLSGEIFQLPYPEMTSALYTTLLDVLPQLLTGVEGHRSLWEDEDARLTTSEGLIGSGVITIEEEPDLELAIVRIPEGHACHPFALHNRTTCTRLLLLQGNLPELQYRYESWVQLVSRRPAPRVDLSELATELNVQEASRGHWAFDGVDRITPRLHLEGSSSTSLELDDIVERLRHHLRTGRPAWDPYIAPAETER